jgi:plastocyanin
MLRRSLLPVLIVTLLAGAACSSDGGKKTASSDGTSSTTSPATSTPTDAEDRASDQPVTMIGPVNIHGSKDLGGTSSADLEIEAYDFYYEPTFVKAAPGTQVKVTVKNSGKVTHTFTSVVLGIDEQLAPGQEKTLTITLPKDRQAVEYHCRFHGASGMQGAFYAKEGASVVTGSVGSGTTPSSTVAGY